MKYRVRIYFPDCEVMDIPEAECEHLLGIQSVQVTYTDNLAKNPGLRTIIVPTQWLYMELIQ